jgi:hypothetical protein
VTPAFAIPFTGGNKAVSRVVDAMSNRHRRLKDVIEVVHGGWLDEDLWEKYRDLRGMPTDPGDINTERRLYMETAHVAAGIMMVSRNKIRMGTNFRIASAVIADVAGVGWRPCQACGRSGCKVCRGAGWIRPSNTFRADACGSRHPDYNHRLRPVYELLRSGLDADLRSAKAEYDKTAACLAERHDQGLFEKT